MIKKQNQCRIIAGRWRGRKITFPDDPALRPTPDRVRETVFNWLMQTIQGAACLDLFAGSGALGFEALSRGAASVVMIDQSKTICQQLQENGKILAADNLTILQGRSPEALSQLQTQFDIVFLDPPFEKNLIGPTCQALLDQHCLKPDALIYIEVEKTLTDLPLPQGWEILREKVAGLVRYCLVSS